MIKELLYKWLDLDPIHCETCEVLRLQLEKSENERRELLYRILDKDKSEPPQVDREEFKPVTPPFIPWRLRQQMLEAEDHKKAQLMKQKAEEIAELEREVGVQ